MSRFLHGVTMSQWDVNIIISLWGTWQSPQVCFSSFITMTQKCVHHIFLGKDVGLFGAFWGPFMYFHIVSAEQVLSDYYSCQLCSTLHWLGTELTYWDRNRESQDNGYAMQSDIVVISTELNLSVYLYLCVNVFLCVSCLAMRFLLRYINLTQGQTASLQQSSLFTHLLFLSFPIHPLITALCPLAQSLLVCPLPIFLFIFCLYSSKSFFLTIFSHLFHLCPPRMNGAEEGMDREMNGWWMNGSLVG